MLTGREKLSLDDELESLRRSFVANPENATNRLRLEAAYLRAGRAREAMLLMYPDIYKIVDEGHPAALMMMKHYDYHRPDFDADIPDNDRSMEALYQHLKTNPNLAEEIKQMKKPTLQLVPVFEDGQEAGGFSRLCQTMNRKPNTSAGQIDTFVTPRLSRWGYDTQVSEKAVKIIGWRVAITEGVEILLRGGNPYAGEQLEQQLTNTQTDYQERKLFMIDNVQYALLQMQTLSQLDATQGIDDQCWTVLDDPSRKKGSWVVVARWRGARVRFLGVLPDNQRVPARFRPSVVVDV